MHSRFLIAKECVTALWPSLAAYHKATRPFLVSSWVTNILNLLFLKCPISHINIYHHWLKIIQFLISDKMMMTMKKMTSAEAPLSTSNLATSRYPAWAAQCKAVQPSCNISLIQTFPYWEFHVYLGFTILGPCQQHWGQHPGQWGLEPCRSGPRRLPRADTFFQHCPSPASMRLATSCKNTQNPIKILFCLE